MTKIIANTDKRQIIYKSVTECMRELNINEGRMKLALDKGFAIRNEKTGEFFYLDYLLEAETKGNEENDNLYKR